MSNPDKPRRRGRVADYDVGFGKPPTTSRFKPGKSGNPKGRPKGSRNLSKMLVDAVMEPITITVNGRRKSVPKFAAVAIRLVNKAVEGDSTAIRQLVQLFPSLDAMLDVKEASRITPVADAVVIATLMQRLGTNSGDSAKPVPISSPKEPK